MEGKAQGLKHELHGEEPKPWQNDATLKHKIESEVLRNYDGKINVNVEYGVAVLRGELQQPEQIRGLEEDVARVPGVKGVENLLHLPKSPTKPIR
jgi:osmotically-inducible protein OsmY